MPTRTRLFAAGFLVLLATMKARSDDTELVAKQLAAIKSLRSQISRHSYRLPDDKVRELVIALLRRDETKVPKAMPPMEKLRSDLDVDFESAWNDMINKATAGLDMKGNLELINEIRGFLKDSGIRSAAQAGHDKFVKEELPASLDRVRKQIVEEQTTELRQALTGLIEAGTLTQELVIDASQNGTAAGVGLLTRSVLEKVSEATRETLLVDSFETLSEQAEQIVADGTEQLKEQQEVLGETPVAVSQQAIHTEFETELCAIADKQKVARAGTPLLPVYGVFSQVQEAVPGKARQSFCQRVAETSDGIWQAFANGTRQLPSRHADLLENMVHDDPSTHFRYEPSLQAAQPRVQDLLRDGQQWIADRLSAALEQSTIPGDASYDVARFRQEVIQVLNDESSAGHVAWKELEKGLKRIFETQLFPKVREKIQQEQATQFAPILMDGQWLPEEIDLATYGTNVTERHLASLPVWRDRPPQRTEVLYETWKLWIDKANKALQICKDAQAGQQRIVAQLREEIADSIRKGPSRTQADWVIEYCDRTRESWMKTPEVAAQNTQLCLHPLKNKSKVLLRS